MKPKTQGLMLAARRAGKVIPAFNIPYLPVMEAVVCAPWDTNTFALVRAALKKIGVRIVHEGCGGYRASMKRTLDERARKAHNRAHYENTKRAGD